MKNIRLYHVSTWAQLEKVKVGDRFELIPGNQNAEGKGVYFAEAQERVSAADAINCNGKAYVATVIIETSSPQGWWRTKKSCLKKKGRARTWHSDGKSIKCQIVRIVENKLYCSWYFNFK